MVRIAHLSDIHVSAQPLGWQLRDFLSKRLTSWMNFRLLGREHRFRNVEKVLPILMTDIKERGNEHIIFSGDATAMGFESECRRAAEFMKIGDWPGLAVPGNHDYITRCVAKSGMFERCFAPWQVGRRIGDHVYPFAQKVGPVWLVGVNSSTGNLFTWDATGKVGREQLARLSQLLAQLEPGPRILVTHFPVCLADGEPEKIWHRLRDLDQVVEVAAKGGVSLWLHGHRHSPYVVTQPEVAPFPVICAGSAGQTNKWTYFEYSITDHHIQACRRRFNPARTCFEEMETFQISLTRPG